MLLASDDEGQYSDDDPSNHNFCIEYALTAGQTVYIKVTGTVFWGTYEYYFMVSKVG